MKIKLRKLIGTLFFLTLAACQSAGITRPDPTVAASAQPDSFSESLYQFSIARLVGMNGDFDGAATALEKAISLDPDSAYLKATLAEIYLHLDRTEESFRLAEDALILDPDILSGHLLLANLHARQNRYGEAVYHLEQAAELEPEDERILFQLALYHNRNGDMDQSISVLKEIVEHSPEETYARLALARAYRQTGLDRLGEEAYRQVLQYEPESYLAITELGDMLAASDNKKEAEQLYRDKVDEFPTNNRLRHKLVGFFIDEGRFDEALKQLDDILETDPVDPAALRRSGLIRFDRQEWSLAGDYFMQLLSLDPADDQALYYLGISREESGNWGGAIASFEQINATSELYADSLIHQAYNLSRLNRTGEAIRLLEENKPLLSSRPEIYDYLSYLYRDLDQTEKALAVIDDGLRKHPDDETLLYRKIVLLEKAGQTARSDQTAQDLLEINPDHVNAMNFLAYSYAVQNIQLDTALDLASRALAAKDESYIRDTLGWIYYRLGRFPEALEQLLNAAGRDPEDPVVHEHLGFVYKAMGRPDDALKAFEKSIGEKGEIAPEVQQAIESLRQVIAE